MVRPLKQKLRALLIIGGIFAFVISFPISNLFIKRTFLASNEDPEFKAVSDILVQKCADCHTSDMAVYPLYYGLPIANGIAQKNIKGARISFLISKDKLAGKVPFTAGDVERLSRAMAKGNMPPAQYILMHWDSALTEREQRVLSKWIDKKLRLFDLRPIPEQNFFQPDKAKASLGKKLFSDKILSDNGHQSCASCHDMQKVGCDQSTFSLLQNGNTAPLNTPTILNSAYNIAQYWNGRAESLKDQAFMAVSSPIELNSNWNDVCGRLKESSSYDLEFRRIYGTSPSPSTVSDAIAEYERTLLTPGSRLDQFLNGNQKAISSEEKEGYEIFKKHECFVCHTGPSLGGISFEKLGRRKDFFQTASASPFDRYQVTRRKEDHFVYKVPTLRNVAETAPYLHDGSAKSLEDAVAVMSEYQVDTPLTKDEQRKVVSFLKTLTGRIDK